MEQFAALMLMGVRVREVKNLAEGNIWLPEDRLLLIDEGTGDAGRDELCRWLLASPELIKAST